MLGWENGTGSCFLEDALGQSKLSSNAWRTQQLTVRHNFFKIARKQMAIMIGLWSFLRFRCKECIWEDVSCGFFQLERIKSWNWFASSRKLNRWSELWPTSFKYWMLWLVISWMRCKHQPQVFEGYHWSMNVWRWTAEVSDGLFFFGPDALIRYTDVCEHPENVEKWAAVSVSPEGLDCFIKS